MKDEYSTLRAAFHAGARIQAWTLREFAKSSNDGYWRLLGDNQTHEEPKFSCEPHLYRVYPEDRHLIAELGQEVGAVAWNGLTKDEVAQYVGQISDYGTGFVSPLFAVIENIDSTLKARNTSPAHTSEARDANSARYEWLKRHISHADFEPADGVGIDLIFRLPTTCAISANLDATLDAAMRQERGNE